MPFPTAQAGSKAALLCSCFSKHSFPLNATITFTKVMFTNPPLKVKFSSDCTIPQLPDIFVILGLTVTYSICSCGEKRHCRAADEWKQTCRDLPFLCPQTGSVWLNEQACGGGSRTAACQGCSPLMNQHWWLSDTSLNCSSAFSWQKILGFCSFSELMIQAESGQYEW